MATLKRGLGRLAGAGFAPAPEVTGQPNSANLGGPSSRSLIVSRTGVASRIQEKGQHQVLEGEGSSVQKYIKSSVDNSTLFAEFLEASEGRTRSLLNESVSELRAELLLACENRFQSGLSKACEEQASRLDALRCDFSSLLARQRSELELAFSTAIQNECTKRESAFVELHSHIASAQAMAESAQAAMAVVVSQSSECIVSESHLTAKLVEERKEHDSSLDVLRQDVSRLATELQSALEPVFIAIQNEISHREASISELRRHIASAHALAESAQTVVAGVATQVIEERRERDSSLRILRNDFEGLRGLQSVSEPGLGAALQTERSERKSSVMKLESEVAAALAIAEGAQVAATTAQSLRFKVGSAAAEVSSPDDMMDQVSKLEFCIEEFRGDVANSALVMQQQFSQTERAIKNLQERTQGVEENIGRGARTDVDTTQQCNLQALEGVVNKLGGDLEEMKRVMRDRASEGSYDNAVRGKLTRLQVLGALACGAA